MASLPSQHPHLALHLTDRALTPIISSSSSSTSTPTAQHQPHHQTPKPTYRPKRQPTFSTSPPTSPSDESPPSSSPSTSSSVTAAHEEEEALSSLSSTALSAYDAAKRLGKGAPLRTMVEYPDGGLVVLHSYMCPMSLVLGAPGRNGSSTSLHTAVGGPGAMHRPPSPDGMDGTNGDALGPTTVTAAATAVPGVGVGFGLGMGATRPRTPTTRPLSSSIMDPMDSEGEDGEESPNAPPMLISTVVAPRAEDLREARRAAGRLERIARVFQTEWVVEGGGSGGVGV